MRNYKTVCVLSDRFLFKQQKHDFGIVKTQEEKLVNCILPGRGQYQRDAHA